MLNEPLTGQPTNPYAPTSEVELSLETCESEAHRIRRKHIKHEVSIKTMGLLYLLGAISFIPVGLLVLVQAISNPQRPDTAFVVGAGIVYTLLGCLQAWVGWGLYRFYQPQRVVGVVLSCLGLLAVPVGTIINVYFLWLLGSKKGRQIFAADYQKIIQETPEVRYRTSVFVIVLAVIMISVMIVGLMMTVF